MNPTAATGRKVLVLVLTTLITALALFAGASATTATIKDAHAGLKNGYGGYGGYSNADGNNNGQVGVQGLKNGYSGEGYYR